MAAAHPFGAFVRCRFKRIGCVRTIKVNRPLGHRENRKIIANIWATERVRGNTSLFLQFDWKFNLLYFRLQNTETYQLLELN
jgi:hypothetical protein